MVDRQLQYKVHKGYKEMVHGHYCPEFYEGENTIMKKDISERSYVFPVLGKIYFHG